MRSCRISAQIYCIATINSFICSCMWWWWWWRSCGILRETVKIGKKSIFNAQSFQCLFDVCVCARACIYEYFYSSIWRIVWFPSHLRGYKHLHPSFPPPHALVEGFELKGVIGFTGFTAQLLRMFFFCCCEWKKVRSPSTNYRTRQRFPAQSWSRRKRVNVITGSDSHIYTS